VITQTAFTWINGATCCRQNRIRLAFYNVRYARCTCNENADDGRSYEHVHQGGTQDSCLAPKKTYTIARQTSYCHCDREKPIPAPSAAQSYNLCTNSHLASELPVSDRELRYLACRMAWVCTCLEKTACIYKIYREINLIYGIMKDKSESRRM